MLIDLLLILTGFLGSIVIFIILLNYNFNKVLNLNLIFIIFITTSRLMLLGLEDALKNTDLVSFNLIFTDFIGITIPLSYLYFNNLINNTKTLNYKDLYHILFYLLVVFERKYLLVEMVFHYEFKYNFYSFFVIYAFLYVLVIGFKLNKHIWHKKGSLDISKEQNSLIKKWSIYLFILLTALIIRYYISFVLVYNYDVSQAPIYGIWVNSIFWIILLITILSSPKILYGYSYLENSGLIKNSKSINISNWNLISKSEINYTQDQALEDKIAANIENYINALETSLSNNNYFRKPEFTIKELALAINIPVSHLKYLYKYHSKISFSDHKKIIRIKDALDLIDQNYLHTHTIESLSKKVGFASYNPFFTSFKEVVGKSPIQYISNLNGNLKSS